MKSLGYLKKKYFWFEVMATIGFFLCVLAAALGFGAVNAYNNGEINRAMLNTLIGWLCFVIGCGVATMLFASRIKPKGLKEYIESSEELHLLGNK